ncbi:hypothetical protein B0H14DRAFT_2756850 [Mycena olivaceomarginata]|nr:hypothetical protein B0H14DRAFT_2756850 [Mycena olivaceomarginata]
MSHLRLREWVERRGRAQLGAVPQWRCVSGEGAFEGSRRSPQHGRASRRRGECGGRREGGSGGIAWRSFRPGCATFRTPSVSSMVRLREGGDEGEGTASAGGRRTGNPPEAGVPVVRVEELDGGVPEVVVLDSQPPLRARAHQVLYLTHVTRRDVCHVYAFRTWYVSTSSLPLGVLADESSKRIDVPRRSHPARHRVPGVSI